MKTKVAKAMAAHYEIYRQHMVESVGTILPVNPTEWTSHINLKAALLNIRLCEEGARRKLKRGIAREIGIRGPMGRPRCIRIPGECTCGVCSRAECRCGCRDCLSGVQVFVTWKPYDTLLREIGHLVMELANELSRTERWVVAAEDGRRQPWTIRWKSRAVNRRLVCVKAILQRQGRSRLEKYTACPAAP